MKHLIPFIFLSALLAACTNDIQPSPSHSPSAQSQPEETTPQPSTGQNMAPIGSAPNEIVKEAPQPTIDDRMPEEMLIKQEMNAPMDASRSYAIGDESASMGSVGKSSGLSSMAGRLTAGELNDFQKWKMWEDLSANELNHYQKTWNIGMHQRYCVMIRNKRGFPIIDARCTLMDANGASLWTGRSDNTGKAELWASIQAGQQQTPVAKIKIETTHKTEWIHSPKPFQKGINFIKIHEDCDTKEQVDILFTVDATGSMGDEIRYLQDELLDVLKKIQAQQNISLYTGSVFYRDHGDEYVTRSSPLTANMGTTTHFISQQSANGGGDGPEAVDDALIASIEQMNWRPSARTRILFLILDAPPHSTPAHQERLRNAMRLAAHRGIRIVPLVASGGGYEMDKSMEYLMRAMALATNGTYVFLTNHSGIGNHHTAPSTDSYKVETLNQILVRIVHQYTEAPGCREKDWEQVTETIDATVLTIEQTTPEQPTEKTISLECYPNPADNELWLKASHEMSDVYLSDNSGKLLEQLTLQAGTNRLDTSLYPSGVYFIKVLVGTTWLSKKFIVLHI